MTRFTIVIATLLLLITTNGFSDQQFAPAAAGVPLGAGSPGPPTPAPHAEALRQQLIQLVTSKSYQMSADELQRAIISFGRAGQQLPPAAVEILDVLKQQAGEIQRAANSKIKVHRKEAIVELRKLQNKLTRNANLDEAVAVRDLIRALQVPLISALPDPGTLTAYREHLGRTFYFRVTGNSGGYAYGTDIYTDDSQLASTLR